MSLEQAVDAVNPSEPTVADGDSIKKMKKTQKEFKYYYTHREEILEKKRQKKMEDPEYKARYEERQRRKAEKEQQEKQRAEKKELRKKMVDQMLSPAPIPSGRE